VQVCHDGNMAVHAAEYEGRPERRPLTRAELQAFLDAADDHVERAASSRRKGWLASFRDATLFKVVYGSLLAERGVKLSREQVYRLVTGVPERLSLATPAALCGILGCQPGELIEITAAPAPARPTPASPAQLPRPVRARVAPGQGGR
jgi:DNA-binding Xre family transcriptional regulator